MQVVQCIYIPSAEVGHARALARPRLSLQLYRQVSLLYNIESRVGRNLLQNRQRLCWIVRHLYILHSSLAPVFQTKLLPLCNTLIYRKMLLPMLYPARPEHPPENERKSQRPLFSLVERGRFLLLATGLVLGSILLLLLRRLLLATDLSDLVQRINNPDFPIFTPINLPVATQRIQRSPFLYTQKTQAQVRTNNTNNQEQNRRNARLTRPRRPSRPPSLPLPSSSSP